MTRKKKPARAPKDEVFNVRCTTKQKSTLEAVASREGLGLSSWVLHAALVTAEAKEAQR